MSTELIDLSAAGRPGAGGELDPAELAEASTCPGRGRRLNAFTWVADGPPEGLETEAALGGVPLAVKDLFCTEGVPSQAGSRILEGYRPPYSATIVESSSNT